nr:Chain A, Chimeric Peptide [synthetic construct]
GIINTLQKYYCRVRGAICHPVFCPRRYKQIGTCGLPGTKCCKKP